VVVSNKHQLPLWYQILLDTPTCGEVIEKGEQPKIQVKPTVQMKNITCKAILLMISMLFIAQIELTAQTITSMSPNSGALAGNTLITIKGTGFDSTNSVGVFFKNTVSSATKGVGKVTYTSTDMTFKTPAVSSAETFSVYLELKGDVVIPCSTNFEYKIPVVTKITPNSGSVVGNDTITIKGQYFSNTKSAVAVNFKKNGAQKIISVSDTLITVTNPSFPKAETVNITVGVQSVFSDTSKVSNFTYVSDAPDSIYTIDLKNLTGLSTNYKVYVLGFSPGSQKMLTVNATDSLGTFNPMPADSGFVQSYELGKDITKIQLSSTNPIVGARIYFFVSNDTTTYKDISNLTSNHNLGFKYSANGAAVSQVGNPPQTAYPQYNYIEATFKANEGLYIDISTVDGFFFPLSLIAQNKNGVEMGRIGQPNNVSAEQVVNAYKPFMKKLKLGGEDTDAYNALFYKVNSDLTALLNPGLYLDGNTSELETVFDADLQTLFTDASLNMNIWQNGKDGFAANYKVTPVKSQTFPGTKNTHEALAFTSTGNDTLHMFNPVGFSVVSYEVKATKVRKAIMGKIDSSKLSFDTPLPLTTKLAVGMYLSAGGGSDGLTTQITKINKANGKIVSVNLKNGTMDTTSLQYKFSKAPTNYYYSSAQMVYAGIGLMADGPARYPADTTAQIVVNGLENQLSTALNRGVGVKSFKGNKTEGRTTIYWATETNWYPKGVPQNYFSYFMHTAKTKGGVNIFSFPKDSVMSARKEYMAMAYGFAYDENPNPKGGLNQPQVPSEFSGSFPKSTTKLTLELGPWLTPKNK
jgi:hypothetical protein